MPNRSSKRFYDQHYKWLAKTDGHYCLICRGNGEFRAPPGYDLQIHHTRIDLSPKDPKYWEPEDTCLTCLKCNLSLRYKSVEELQSIIHRYRALNVCIRERERVNGCEKLGPPVADKSIMDIVDFMHGSTEMQAKCHYEPRFSKFVWERLTEFGSYPEKDLLNEFAYISRASQATLKRYLDSYCSTSGPCRRVKDGDSNTLIIFRFPVNPEHDYRT